MIVFLFDRIENHCGKMRNCWLAANISFSHYFHSGKAFFVRGLCCKGFNPLPDDKILDQTKLKAFAGDKLNVTKIIISVFDRVENIVGKEEIAFTRNFSFSHNVFKRLLP